MGRFELMPQKAMDKVVSHLSDVQDPLKERAVTVRTDADANLTAARASTTHHKISGPEHETEIHLDHGEVDHYISMTGSNPMAIEYGHFPSGYFAPEKYGKITQAPHGLYILTNAGISHGMEGTGKHSVPSGEVTPHGEPQTKSRDIGKR